MRIPLDECVDWRLLRDLPDYQVRTLKQLGWERIKNGALLRLAASEFDAFITVDQNLPYQQNLSDIDLAVIVLCGGTTRLPDLRKLLPSLLQTLQNPQKRQFHIVRGRS